MMRSGLFLLLVACGTPAHSPDMDPGEDCLSCHATGDHIWSVAGTVFDDPNGPPSAGVESAQVLVTDAKGKQLTLNTTAAGNFYTAEKLVFPVQVEVQKGDYRFAMDDTPAVGSCNTCHNSPPLNGAIGRLFVPTANTPPQLQP